MRIQENDTVIPVSLETGKAEAFEVIFNMYYRQLCFFATGLVMHKEAAEDLVTDAFIKLWQSKLDLTTIEKLKSWLFTVVRNSALNLIRTRARHETSHQEIGFLSSVEENIDLLLVRSEVLQFVYEKIMNLPTQCRQVVKSIFVEGQTVKEVARKMNLAEQTVLNQKNKGIKLIKANLLKNNLLSSGILGIAYSMLQA